jgi:hypothetical protein
MNTVKTDLVNIEVVSSKPEKAKKLQGMVIRNIIFKSCEEELGNLLNFVD